ncbi:MAG TPA: HD domain-containing protein [Draconibacterium sp.]|nr:HD domain-containing protein [Draconibacterium sp.]HRX11754.1 HD domain-containing protein [Draconibacterium sp.]
MNTGKLKRFIINKLQSELSDKLTYHGVQHTLHVLKMCNKYIKRMHIEAHDAYLLRTAALLHDTGFIWDFDNHENASINYTAKLLPDWNYSDHEINLIIDMINATKKPQLTSNILEEILADSDLDYLGTNYFYKVGNKLYKELLAYNKISTEEEWDKIQVQFLRDHHYHTPFAQKYREPVKQKHLNEILDKWGWK